MTTQPDRPPAVDHETAELAAAAVRKGRDGFILAVRNPAGRWVAFGDYVCTTRDDARMKARAAMAEAGDPSRVAVVAADGTRLRVPTPRALKGAPTLTPLQIRALVILRDHAKGRTPETAWAAFPITRGIGHTVATVPTVQALARRGLAEMHPAEIGRPVRARITDAGRAWLTAKGAPQE